MSATILDMVRVCILCMFLICVYIYICVHSMLCLCDLVCVYRSRHILLCCYGVIRYILYMYLHVFVCTHIVIIVN